MKRAAYWGLCAALGLGLAMVAATAPDTASAQGKRGKGAPTAAPAAPAAPVDAPTVKNAAGIELRPTGLQWGMTPEQVFTLYDTFLEEDYSQMLKNAQPGPQLTRVESQLANDRAAMRRAKVDFGSLPTGVDSTALKGEYTYNNQESMVAVNRRNHGARYLFFIQNKLWKIYDEHTLSATSPSGATFEDAAKKYAERYQVGGRVIEPDYSVNRSFLEVDWQDAKTHIRLIDRSGMQVLGVVFEDRGTLAQLRSLRVNKEANPDAIDPDIQAVIGAPSDQPGPPGDRSKTDKSSKGRGKGKK
jgi:hypothetical protein